MVPRGYIPEVLAVAARQHGETRIAIIGATAVMAVMAVSLWLVKG